MILAAGLGTRLRPLTYVMPKPVAPVLNRPIVVWIADLLAEHGFEDVVANLSYLPEQIREVLGDGSGFGLRITYSEEPEPLGTAGGVGKVRDFLAESESFLIISGDALTDIDLSSMRAAHQANVERGAIATLATKRVEDTTQFGVVITGEDGRIQGFQEKPSRRRPSRISPTAASTCSARRSSSTFRRPISRAPPAMTTSRRASSTGRWMCSRRCSTAISPSTRTSSTGTGTTSDRWASSSRAISMRSREPSRSSRRSPRSPRASTPDRGPTWTG